MTRVQFFDLAERVSVYAREHPRSYRIRVVLLAVLGYTVIFGMMGVCGAALVLAGLGLAQGWFRQTGDSSGRIVIFCGALLISVAVTLFSMVRSLFVKIPAPAGRRVRPDDAPELFAMIDEIVATSRAPRPHTVLLNWDFNAAVQQRPRFGWLGWTRDFLVLGVPLMAALTPEQFKAVLAHEFGHLRGGHGRFSNWVYRLRIIWDQTLQRLARQRRKVVLLVVKFLRWYTPRFNAYTYALARAQEFEADRWAAQIAGLPATGEALINLWTRGSQMQEQFWQPLNQRACREADVPHGVFASMFTLLRRVPAREDRRRWLRGMLGRVTDGTDTHPAPVERLASLGLPATLDELDSDAMWSEPVEPEADDGLSAATALLGTRLDEFVGELETSWRVHAAPAWRQRFERTAAVRTRLYALEREQTIAPGGELPEAVAWERARLENEIAETPAEARAAVERFVVRWPGHAMGQLVLGQLLLRDDDEAGLAHLEEATRLDGRLAASSEEALAAYLRRSGQGEEAAARRRLAVSHGDVLDAARLERQRVTPRDRFLPHALDEASLFALREQLARHPRIVKVWLARKAVVHHPEQPWYVMVCVFQWRWTELNSPQALSLVSKEIRTGLKVAGQPEFCFLLLDKRHRNHPLARKVRKTTGSEILPVPVPKGRRTWWGGRRPVVVVQTTPAPAAATPPPLPIPADIELPPPLPRLPTAMPRAASRPSGRGAFVAALVVILTVLGPFGYFGYKAFLPGGMWHRIAANFRRTTAGGSGGMMAEATAPIPRDPQATTAEADRRATLAWGRRTMLGGYDRNARHDPRWHAAARAFIERTLPWWAGVHDDPVTSAELVAQARTVLSLGCDDPLVLYFAGLVEEHTDRQSPVAGPLLTRALLGFQNAPYPRGVALVAAAELVADCDRRRDGTGESKPVKQWWLLWFKQALQDGSFTAQEQDVLAGRLSQGEGSLLFDEQRDACCEIVDTAGDRAVAPWLRRMLSGKRHVADAWQARGHDYAANVTTAGWRGFESGMALARTDLTASWQLNPRRPEAATLMVSVALGQNASGTDGPRAWFDRAVRAQVDYGPAYDRFVTTLLPQWGGSSDAVRAFGQTCADTADYDTGVPIQMNEIAQELEPGETYGNARFYATLERVFAGYEEARSQVGRRIYHHCCHARAAELTGRYADAYRLLKEVDFQISPELAAELAEDPSSGNYIERLAAYGGPGGDDARSGDRLVQRGRADSALERFRAALAAAASEPRAAVYLRGRIAMLETDRQLADGKWVSFQPMAGPGGAPVGWTSKLGTWKVAADGALIGQTGASGLMLVNDTRVGADFEVRGEMDFLPGAPSEQQAGVVFGHPDMESDDWQSFRLKRNGPDGAIATISCHWYDGPKRALTVPDHNAFVLQSWRGQITLTINGAVVFRAQRIDKGRVNDGSVLVGLGGYSHHGNPFTVAFRQLQLRRINGAPLAATTGSSGGERMVSR